MRLKFVSVLPSELLLHKRRLCVSANQSAVCRSKRSQQLLLSAPKVSCLDNSARRLGPPMEQVMMLLLGGDPLFQRNDSCLAGQSVLVGCCSGGFGVVRHLIFWPGARRWLFSRASLGEWRLVGTLHLLWEFCVCLDLVEEQVPALLRCHQGHSAVSWPCSEGKWELPLLLPQRGALGPAWVGRAQ
jgi:hypothetical protein